MKKIIVISLLILSMCICRPIKSTAVNDMANDYVTGCSPALGPELCDSSLNAVGDLLDIDITGLTEEEKGRITADTRINVMVPTEESKALYSFIPSTGHVAGKLLRIVFVGYAIDSPSLKEMDKTAARRHMSDVQSIVKVYRRFEDEPLWTEIAAVLRKEPLGTHGPVSITLKPDGTAVLRGTDDPNPLMFFLGQRF